MVSYMQHAVQGGAGGMNVGSAPSRGIRHRGRQTTGDWGGKTERIPPIAISQQW